MDEQDSGVPNGLVAPCGHRNPPHAHFCDVCGATLQMQCPRCHAINRRQAHFCNMCGSSLRDARRAHATPSIDPSEPLAARSPEIEPDSAPSPAEPLAPEGRAAIEGMDGPQSFHSSRSKGESGRRLVGAEPDEVKRLDDLQRFSPPRRRSRHVRAWVGIAGATVVVALFGIGLVRTYIPARSATRAFIDTETKTPIPGRAAGTVSAVVSEQPPVRTGSADPAIGPD